MLASSIKGSGGEAERCEPGQVSLIQIVIMHKVQKLLGIVVDLKNVFLSKIEEWHQTIGHKDCGYPGNKETERKRVSSGKNVGYNPGSVFGKV